MTITFGQAKNILAQYQGKGGKVPTATGLDSFTIKVLQYLLISGSPNAERSFELYVTGSWFTAPYELETPLKIKINGRIGNVVSKWFEFRSGSDFSSGACYDAHGTLSEDANPYYTAFDIPAGGGQVGVMGTVEEDCNASLIVQGDDLTGREVFTNHKGAEIAGEYLQIRKGVLTWSNVVFRNITGIVKTRTNGYTPLHWKKGDRVKGFLADYSPTEEVPAYRRFNINIPQCPLPAKVTILGKTRIKQSYAENDRIPFDNLYTIEVAGQQVNSQYNDDLDSAVKKDNFVQSLVNREAVHKRPNNGNPLEVYYDNSAGIIKGIA